jgi:hypothetical protein
MRVCLRPSMFIEDLHCLRYVAAPWAGNRRDEGMLKQMDP